MYNCKRDGHDYNHNGVCRACGINRKQVEYEQQQDRPACYPCVDVAQYGDIMCKNCAEPTFIDPCLPCPGGCGCDQPCEKVLGYEAEA